jgi:TRAP-type mannitol/chloroaromatic compound transport system permease large subunit
MPKTRRRKKATKNASASRNGTVRGEVERAATTRAVPYAGARPVSMQNVVFSAMVALGFWGFTVFCLVFYTVDPNHYLYAGILALTALGWSVLLVRRWSQYRRQE